MFESIKNFFANLLTNNSTVWHGEDVLYFVSLAALSLVILSSLVLVTLMMRYRGKRPLDLSLLFREVTFILVLARTFILIFLGWTNALVSTAIFLALLIACALTLWFVIQEHRKGRRVLGSGRG